MQKQLTPAFLAFGVLASLAALPVAAGADAFLAQPSPAQGAPPEKSLRARLEGALGGEELQAVVARSERLELALRSTFVALPKGERGTVGAAAARYALHRLFVQQHGWQLQGLDPSGGNWSVGTPTAAFGGRASEEVRAAFDGQLDSRGLSLPELALLAAMLEHSVHGQIEVHLRSIFRATGHRATEVLDEPSATGVIEAYMAAYILGVNASALTREALQHLDRTVQEQHPSWPETMRFLGEVQREVRPGATTFAFADIAAVVEEAADRFGQWQSRECSALKDVMVGMEDVKGAGRVRLADFYAGALHGDKWQFSESVEYLRQLGAIDDTDPAGPRVIIPNYVYSPANCLASSSFYAVCCIDECEELLDHLESSVGQPTATPAEIVDLVGALPPASGNGTLSAGLVRRLEEVAERHGGRVPLHGRLLAQWLHHARPRECPYPHVSGTTVPQRPEEWELALGKSTAATEDEMMQHIEAARSKRAAAAAAAAAQPEKSGEGLCSAMWTMEEELVDAHAHKRHGEATSGALSLARDVLAERTAARAGAIVAAAASVALGLAKMLRPALGLGHPYAEKAEKSERYSV